MADYGYIVQELGEQTCTDKDDYGYYNEVEIVLTPEYITRAYDQLGDRINDADDVYLDAYLRRYEDATRIFIVLNEDFTSNGDLIEEELIFDEDEMYDLNQIDIGDYDF